MIRYALLVILNAPIVFLGLTNALTNYKLHKISKERFIGRLAIWLVILICVALAFPIYNYLSGRELFEIYDVSLLNIVLTTTVIYLIYIINHQRQKIELLENTLRKFHEEISIKLSEKK
ncbi:MAG: hypothetical protein LBU20_02185 [Candidatus Nomurabacteria bacterium]|jgi:CDP-diglyceride synthetase|nr:hypothetical protein [Candidatus Nomurabacteria bacterium]